MEPSKYSLLQGGIRQGLPAFHRAGSAREIDNFLLGLEAYFRAIGIGDDTQKVCNVTFSLKEITFFWWHCRCDDVKRGSNPINTWDKLKRELKK